MQLKILARLEDAWSMTLDEEATTKGKVLWVQLGDRVFEIWWSRKEAEKDDTSTAS